MVCANPDRVVQRGDKMIYCAGALADLYEAAGRHGGDGRQALSRRSTTSRARRPSRSPAGRSDPARILAVGDGIATDVKGANAQGLDIGCSSPPASMRARRRTGAGGSTRPLDALLGARRPRRAARMGELAW